MTTIARRALSMLCIGEHTMASSIINSDAYRERLTHRKHHIKNFELETPTQPYPPPYRLHLSKLRGRGTSVGATCQWLLTPQQRGL